MRAWVPTAGLLLLLLGGCGLPENVVVLTPDDDGHVGRALIQNAQGEGATLDRPFEAVGAPSDHRLSQSFDADRGRVEKEFSGTLAATPRPPAHFIVRFVTGQAVIDPASQATIVRVAERAKTMQNADLSVVGHTDSTGSASANLPLSLRRAEAVRDALVAAGVAAASIEVTYHGANNPLIPGRPGVPEARNRRVEITIR